MIVTTPSYPMVVKEANSKNTITVKKRKCDRRCASPSVHW